MCLGENTFISREQGEVNEAVRTVRTGHKRALLAPWRRNVIVLLPLASPTKALEHGYPFARAGMSSQGRCSKLVGTPSPKREPCARLLRSRHLTICHPNLKAPQDPRGAIPPIL